MNLKKTLEDYGLSKKEASLYLNCLELGSASVYKISKKAELPRSTCYEVLNTLGNKGLVSSFRKKNIKYYSAEDPRQIINRAKEKVESLEQSLPLLNALYGTSKSKPSVRFYQGLPGMKLILEEILKDGKAMVGFSSVDDHFAILRDYWPEFLKQRIKKRFLSK